MSNNRYADCTDYEGRCGNCHERLDADDAYCRYCGTKRGEGAFAPYDNYMPILYGPLPVKRTHTCNACGFEWAVCAMVDEEKFCPKCGHTVTVVEATGSDRYGW